MTSRWQRSAGGPSTDTVSDFDAGAFERELAQAEQELQNASRHLQPTPTAPATDDDPHIFRGFNLLAGGREGLRRQRLAAADAKLVNPKATLIITAVAWFIAVVVAIVAVTFSTKDYSDGRNTPLLSTRFVRMDSVRMPIISICGSRLDMGGFGLLDREKNTRYIGIPFFTVRSVRNLENDTEARFWPGVLDASDEAENVIVRGAYRGPPGTKCAKKFTEISLERSREDKSTTLAREGIKDSCQFCYQIGRDPPLYFARDRHNRQGNGNPFLANEGITLHLVSSPFYSSCLLFDDPSRVSEDHWDFMQREILRKAPELQSKGYLNWKGAVKEKDLTNETLVKRTLLTKEDSNYRALQASLQEGMPNSPDFERVREGTRDMMCHIYFWSGFFYPAANKSVDIRYEYNRKNFTWDRVGKGPYLREARPEKAVVGTLRLEDQETKYAARPLEVYQEDSESYSGRITVDNKEIVGTKDLYRLSENARLIATIEDFNKADITFKLQKFEGKLSFKPTTTLVNMDNAAGRIIFVSHLINLRMDSFEVEEITRRDSTSLIQYLVDAIGYISMALGFTVYSLLIGPTNLFFLGVDRKPKTTTAGKKTNGDGDDADEGETTMLEDSGAAGPATRSAGPSSSGLRFRVGLQRQHYTGPNEPLQRIA